MSGVDKHTASFDHVYTVRQKTDTTMILPNQRRGSGATLPQKSDQKFGRRKFGSRQSTGCGGEYEGGDCERVMAMSQQSDVSTRRHPQLTQLLAIVRTR